MQAGHVSCGSGSVASLKKHSRMEDWYRLADLKETRDIPLRGSRGTDAGPRSLQGPGPGPHSLQGPGPGPYGRIFPTFGKRLHVSDLKLNL